MTHEYTSKEIKDTAGELADLKRAHLGQQATYLENALSKVETDGTKEGKRTKSIRRIVAAMLRGQGIDHPAVDLLREKGRRS
jgi:predicted nuclease of restriction endonuclease-like RecB superfamily